MTKFQIKSYYKNPPILYGTVGVTKSTITYILAMISYPDYEPINLYDRLGILRRTTSLLTLRSARSSFTGKKPRTPPCLVHSMLDDWR